MRCHPCKDAADVARRAADEVARALAERSSAVLVLPAGATPRPLFAELVRRVRARALELSKARIVQLDELVGVAPDDPRSFHAFLRSELFEPAGYEPSRALLLDGSAADPAAEIERHRAALAAIGPADLAVLGIGTNGHVAFNEPGTRASDGARRLALAASTRAGLASAFAEGERPTEGITLGLAELRAARRVRILATGAKKRAVVARLVHEPPSAELPASLLAPHADLALLVDAEADPSR